MIRLTCKSCLFCDQCDSHHVCEFYSPATDEAEDLVLLHEEAADRAEFDDEWKRYTVELYYEAFC